MMAIVALCAILCWPLRYVREALMWRPYGSAYARAQRGLLTDEEFLGLCRDMTMDHREKSQYATAVLSWIARGSDRGARPLGFKGEAYFPPHPEKAVPVLCEAFGHQDPLVQSTAVYLVGRMGPVADSSVGALIGRLSDDWLRARAVWALGEMGPAAAQAVPHLEELLTSSDERTAQIAAEAIRKIREVGTRARMP
jgi:HEAT repeat protein